MSPAPGVMRRERRESAQPISSCVYELRRARRDDADLTGSIRANEIQQPFLCNLRAVGLQIDGGHTGQNIDDVDIVPLRKAGRVRASMSATARPTEQKQQIGDQPMPACVRLNSPNSFLGYWA